jgi:hypothetical protein
MPDYQINVDYGEDEQTHLVRVCEEPDGEHAPKELLRFEFEHPINGRLAKDARREAMKRMAEH